MEKILAAMRDAWRLSLSSWARVGHCTSTVQYGALLHRTSTAAHSRPRSGRQIHPHHVLDTHRFSNTSPVSKTTAPVVSKTTLCQRQRRMLSRASFRSASPLAAGAKARTVNYASHLLAHDWIMQSTLCMIESCS